MFQVDIKYYELYNQRIDLMNVIAPLDDDNDLPFDICCYTNPFSSLVILNVFKKETRMLDWKLYSPFWRIKEQDKFIAHEYEYFISINNANNNAIGNYNINVMVNDRSCFFYFGKTVVNSH